MSRVVVVTGAARGIGLELCRQFLDAGDRVVACPRVPGSGDLAALEQASDGRLRVIPIDIADEQASLSAARQAGEWVDHVDILINNGGIYPKCGGTLEKLDPALLMRGFEVNVVGTLLVTRAFLPLLRQGSGKRIALVSSLMGSAGDNGSGGSWGYRLSKTAVNMAGRNLGHELGREGFICVTLHPGWVQSRMGGFGAPTPVEDSVRDMIHTIENATPGDNGGFRGPGGKTLPY